MAEELNSDKIMIDEQSVKSFMNKLNEKSENELSAIITSYINYKPEMVVAALTVAVDRGFISWDMKIQLLDQILVNFALHGKKIKQTRWESKNAFTGFVDKFQDDEIYNIIDDPSGIVIDVYHAVLVKAKERELISEHDFEEYYREAIKGGISDEEIRRNEMNDFISDLIPMEKELNDEEIEYEKQKNWKCPSCGEIVDMEKKICLNCQSGIPENVEHPGREEIIKKRGRIKILNPVRSGLTLTGIGSGILLLTFARGYSVNDFWHFHYVSLIVGILTAIGGLGLLVSGFFYKKNND